MARVFRYLLADVFTRTALAGNQLAVFPEADGLSAAEMQALARETNLSETTFCFAPSGESTPARIFTVDEELPFAGHPTLGTATALRWTVPALRAAGTVRLALAAGVIPVRFSSPLPEGAPFGIPVEGEMDQPLPVFGQTHDPAAVAVALGLPPAALDPSRPVQTVSTGLPFVVVPLVSVAALGGLAVPQAQSRAYLQSTDGKFFYALAPGPDPTQWRARMQFYGGEDPATGSAAGAATAYLVAHGYAPQGAPLRIEQGAEIGRPSLIHTRAVLEGGPEWTPESYVRVGGSTILVAEGRFFLP